MALTYVLWFTLILEMCILMSFSSLNCSLKILCIKACSLSNDGSSLMVDALVINEVWIDCDLMVLMDGC